MDRPNGSSERKNKRARPLEGASANNKRFRREGRGDEMMIVVMMMRTLTVLLMRS